MVKDVEGGREVYNGENCRGYFVGYLLENSSGMGSRWQCEFGDCESKCEISDEAAGVNW